MNSYQLLRLILLCAIVCLPRVFCQKSYSVSAFAGLGYNGVHDGGPANAAWLTGPNGVWGDTIGNIYVTDSRNYRIRKFNSNGSNSSTLQVGNFYGLWGDSIGNLFVNGDGKIVKIVLSTNIMTTYITISSSQPRGMSGDTSGNLYFVETASNACGVLKITTTPSKVRVAGSGTCDYDDSTGKV